MIQDIDEINVNLSDNNSIDISIDNDNSISVSEGTPTDIAQIMHNEEIRIANENERISNETQRIANEEAREDYITDLKQRVLDGDFNGQDGHDGVDGQDGFSPVANVSKSGDTATITITDKNGTTTSTISDGVDGQDGTDGVDGYSPTVTMSKQGKITTLTITDKNGEHTTEIKDGQDGSGTGDMLKATYDTNDNGIVDNAEKVNNHTVQSDVPANAVFTDTTYTAGTGISISTENVISNTQTSAAWGNITGTLSNQTDLQNALNSKQDIKPTRLTDTSVGTQANPYILDTMNPGYYFIETPTGSTQRYFKLTSTSTAITISNNAGGDGYGMYLYIPNAIDVSSLSDNDIVFYVDRNTVSSSGSISGGLSCYLYKSSANSKLYADTTKGYFKSYGTTITGSAQTWSGVKTFSSVPVCATAPTNDSDLANKKYVDDNKFSGNYNDLSNKPTIPSKTSDLSNDSNFISTSNTSGLIKNDGTIDTTSYSTFSGSYTDLSNKPTIPDELADLSDDSTHRVVTDTEKTTWNNKSDFSGSYADLTNKPTIPSISDSYGTSTANGYSQNYVNDQITDINGDITDIQGDITTINNKLYDTGWVDLSSCVNTSNFAIRYDSTQYIPMARRIGNVVYWKGSIYCHTRINGEQGIILRNVPSQFMPGREVAGCGNHYSLARIFSIWTESDNIYVNEGSTIETTNFWQGFSLSCLGPYTID